MGNHPTHNFCPWRSALGKNYRVFVDNLHQELTCYRLVLGLLRFFKAYLWTQDWAQITFRSEILLNMFKNEAGRWLAKGQKSESGDLSMIYRLSQNEFLLKSFTPKTLWLLILVYKVVLVKEVKQQINFVKNNVVKFNSRRRNFVEDTL